MSIEITCQCGSAYRLEDHRAGEEFICKVCGTAMRLPGAASAEAPVTGEPTAVAMAPYANPTVTATAAPPPAKQPNGPTSGTTQATKTSGTPTSWSPVEQPVWPPQPLQREASPWRAVVHHPPAAWWLVRAVMLGMCAGFLFLPWFTASAKNPFTKKVEDQSITGWEVAKAVAEGIGQAGKTPEFVPDFAADDLPPGAGTVVAGLLMMAGGPCVFAGGLLLAILLLWVVYRYDGKGAGWPFATCWLGLMGFIVGWQVVARTEPMDQMRTVMHQMGFSVGVSPWAYLMLFLMIPICLIARSRPDHSLDMANG